MSISVEVGLLSGRTASMNVDLHETVGAVNFRAQTLLGVGKGQLVHSSGEVLDACSTIQDAGLQNGDSLTLHCMYLIEFE